MPFTCQSGGVVPPEEAIMPFPSGPEVVVPPGAIVPFTCPEVVVPPE